MKKSVKIILCILVFFLLILSYITYKNWNTITAFVDSVRYTQEDVEKSLAENKNVVQEVIDKTEDLTVRDLTEEEAEALQSGELTEEDVIKIITKPDDSNDASNGNSQASSSAETDKNSGQVVSELIAKLYVQKNKYLGMLSGVEAEARQEYLSLSHEERKSQKASMMARYLSRVTAWEKECDGIVYGIIDEIGAELEKSGQDKSLVDELKSVYYNEKRAKKAYYINKYMN